jgi:CheY-like chemotaxis protein
LARTVLLADDSVTAQNMGRRILMDAGYEVITVNNGSAALKKIHESKPDLIVLDVYMPGYGGLEVCQRLKESAETVKIPVLLTVGKMEPFKPEEAKRVRADAHIVKPFDASELLAALTRLEDRIVPADGRGNGKSKKARFWHSEDPAKNFDDSGTEQIAYLAEVKKRHGKAEASEETAAQSESASPNPVTESAMVATATMGAELDRTPDLAASPHSASEESSDFTEPATLANAPVESPSIAASAPPEFSVEREQVSEFQAAPAPVLPPETTVMDAVSVTPEPVPESRPRWVAENVALTAEEASLELEREMQTAQVAASSAETSAEPAPVAEAIPESVEPVLSPESAGEQFSSSPEHATSAFAAAASAGTPAIAESTSAVADSVPEPPVPSEAAAAWENWQHIRETVMAPQNTAAMAETVAQIAQVSAPVEHIEPTESTKIPSELGAPSFAEGQGGSVESAETAAQSSSDALESESLSSIVDSVLAELKPRLMEQIAKKLKSEKK